MDQVENLHDLIQQGNLYEVKRFLINIKHDKHCYNSQHISAAATALKCKQLEIYTLLVSEGVTLGLEEDPEEIVKFYPIETKRQIREIQKQNAKNSNVLHLMFLYERSKLAHDVAEEKRREYFKVIENAFEKLNDILWIKPILEVVACAFDLNIIFDFNQDSIERMDPTANKSTKGICYHGRGDLFIGAKGLVDDSENYFNALAVMAHELSHYALKLLYDNNCNPYCKDDEANEDLFDDILDLTEKKKHFEMNINIVYKYPEHQQCAELIVRVPHLLALYSNDLDQRKLYQETFSELFKFYEEFVLNDLQKQLALMKARSDVNESSTILNGLKKSQPILKTENDSTIIRSSYDKIQIFSSNHPQVTMNSIYHTVQNDSNFDLCYIFLKLDDVNNDEILELALIAHSLLVKPKIIIDCDESEQAEIMQILSKLVENGLKERIFLVANENLNSIEAPDVEVACVSYSLNDFTINYQMELLKRRFSYQALKTRLHESIRHHPIERTELILRVMHLLILVFVLIKITKDYNNAIAVAKTLPSINEATYVDRTFLSRTVPEEFRFGDYDAEHTTEEFLTLVEHEKAVFIGARPGIGKSTAMKKLANLVKEKLSNHWVAYVDLREVCDDMHNNNIDDLLLDESEHLAEFIAQKMLNLGQFETKAFKSFFAQGRVIIFIDNLDGCYGPQLIVTMTNIVQNTNNKFRIAAQHYMAGGLHEIPNLLIFKLKPFTHENRHEFFEKYLRQKKFKEAAIHRKIQRLENEFVNKTSDANSNPLFLEILADWMT